MLNYLGLNHGNQRQINIFGFTAWCSVSARLWGGRLVQANLAEYVGDEDWKELQLQFLALDTVVTSLVISWCVMI